ncbi:hypothetical protein AMTR_s00050p00190460 [Amborella trichopoda]|uniref:Uncharacterized protein n=1 Tax=Amborella trichopoda TaxID=13333 RepID=W1PZA2_AMBTC|nr:hypothetical protein AMTR_s00050p00190460 [Amborella trichopoda]
MRCALSLLQQVMLTRHCPSFNSCAHATLLLSPPAPSLLSPRSPSLLRIYRRSPSLCPLVARLIAARLTLSCAPSPRNSSLLLSQRGPHSTYPVVHSAGRDSSGPYNFGHRVGSNSRIDKGMQHGIPK